MATAVDFLQTAPAPRWVPAGIRRPLTSVLSVTPGVDAATGLELARRWGYAVNVSIHPDTPSGWRTTMQQMAAAAAAEGLPVQHNLWRPMTRSLANPWAAFQATLPESTWCHNAQGARILVEGKPAMSPLAPASAITAIADWAAQQVAVCQALAPISLLLHTGEEGMLVYDLADIAYEYDPAIAADRAATGWNWDRYLSTAKLGQVQPVIDACRDAADGAPCVYYYTGDMRHGISDFHWMWAWNYDYFKPGHYPSWEFYHGEGSLIDYPRGWWVWGAHAVDADLLTLATNGQAQALAAGQPVGYHWVSGGSSLQYPAKVSDPARYLGFLKCVYLLGAVGCCAGWFRSTTTYTGDVGDTPPPWLQQLMALSHVHAAFSHLTAFVDEGDLLPGPNAHAVLPDAPAYEFPTGSVNARVVARRHRGKSAWVLVAWAADGLDQHVTVTLPDLGAVTVLARACGSCYYITPVTRMLLDADGLQPTVGLATRLVLAEGGTPTPLRQVITQAGALVLRGSDQVIIGTGDLDEDVPASVYAGQSPGVVWRERAGGVG